MASEPTRPISHTAADHDEDNEEVLLPAPDVDVTATSLWIHPTNPDALSAEEYMTYNNMLVLADYHRLIQQNFQRLFAMLGRSSRESASRSRSRSSNRSVSEADDIDLIDLHSDEEEEGGGGGGGADEGDDGAQQSKPKRTKRLNKSTSEKNADGTQSAIRSALALMEQGEEMLLLVYKDWIALQKKDVRRTRSKTNDHLTDVNTFFEQHLPEHEAATNEQELITRLQAETETVKDEIYLRLGRAFAEQEPDINKELEHSVPHGSRQALCRGGPSTRLIPERLRDQLSYNAPANFEREPARFKGVLVLKKL
ncbi:hypothetical protein A1O3_09839 [Capronia epimyces CBS 606.96]|uniref:Uncharacterized protein n=1 Tax=Capronia epimyces CBS 606.96 TaxID=1182542 RepID=W9XAU2_9EURO|nr:uncharacterized protein A1O3_09839 [Capronia epimyces CBS 606.96]EXJ77612.1 hypothetical protein A1O3_09839 [Capronia epimyces CBS 606.96]